MSGIRRRGFCALVVVGMVTSLSPLAHAGTIAYEIEAGVVGNQGFGGTLGMSFIVNAPGLVVTSLGVFDDSSDGIGIDLAVRLWSRDDGGTPDDVGDDSGIAILAGQDFSPGDEGTLIGGQRFKPIVPVTLVPGSYMIVGQGFAGGGTDQNGNQGAVDIDGFSINDGGGLITFVANSRFGDPDPDSFPGSPDGPALDGGPDRYGAGTFEFEQLDLGVPGDVDVDTDVDLIDFGIIRDNFGTGTTREQGNLDFRGVTFIEDFAIWKENFPTPAGSAGANSVASVPEPMSILLLEVGLAGLLLARFTRRRRTRK